MRRVLAIVSLLGCTSGNVLPDASDASLEDAGFEDAGDAGEGAPTCDPTFGESGGSCGGDPSGVWRFLALCGRSDPAKDLEEQCPESNLEEAHTGRGRLVIAANGTYDFQIADDFVVTGTLPFSCVESYGGCEPFGSLVTILSGANVACETGETECNCVGTGTQTETSSGAWAAMDGVLTATRTDGRVQRFWYCVEDDRATLRRMGKELVLMVKRN